ncbi:hypothetical protein [Cerasicoccus arenae]|uniref:Transcription elongation factor GreAB n=1 Tax=Cerasicoccus arenae TaxID=424488 RepID=A0A8J3GCN9_9BACT|nr:hypothetical protein [Cerasicoccus arenae]MBK1858332.1 hypothetical protein [Cerasicoccus arenae]GHB90829.1 hypothetical protein GCM10007047_02080 [Cerasicoccus arenae]
MLLKSDVIAALIANLEEELAAAEHASRDAASYATDEESRAESKWDTQGLEASYLAAGQATHAKEVSKALGNIIGQRIELERACTSVQRGALIQCQLGKSREWFFFAPSGGGETLAIDGTEVTVITPDSPIAHLLVGHGTGDDFTLPNGAPGKVLAVL